MTAQKQPRARRTFGQPRQNPTPFRKDPLDPADASPNGRTPEDIRAQTVAYAGVTVGTSPGQSGIWIECPLPGYSALPDGDGGTIPLRVLFRTSNRTKVRQARPSYLEPYDLRQLRRDTIRLEQQRADDQLNDELDKKWEAMRKDVVKRADEYENQYHKDQCKWLANFVLAFEPWPFSDVPIPDPDRPDSYYVLYTDMEDLYVWLINVGYYEALEAAAKNS